MFELFEVLILTSVLIKAGVALAILYDWVLHGASRAYRVSLASFLTLSVAALLLLLQSATAAGEGTAFGLNTLAWACVHLIGVCGAWGTLLVYGFRRRFVHGFAGEAGSASASREELAETRDEIIEKLEEGAEKQDKDIAISEQNLAVSTEMNNRQVKPKPNDDVAGKEEKP